MAPAPTRIPAEETLDYTDDEVDVSLIRWMLSLTPAQRLATLQAHVNSIVKLRATLRHH